MRFLNLKLTSPDYTDLKIEFIQGLNIISAPDRKLFNILRQIPSFGLFGIEQNGTDLLSKNILCLINASTAVSGESVSFISENGNLSIKGSDASGENLKGDIEGKTDPATIRKICSYEDFITSSFFDPEQIQKNMDNVFEKEKIRSHLINNEIATLDFPYFKYRENLLTEKEKELTDLNRDKQLLELKKMKKEKLLKEITISERSLGKLEKRRDSIINYKSALNEITVKIESRNKLSSKINNLKKDLIELREIKDKISSVEEILKEKFSHFSEKGNDQIPDLEQIQESFNSFRDINEQIDKFSINKKRYSGLAYKVIASMLIFSLTAFLFMIFTSSASYVLGTTSGLAAGIAGVSGLLYYFKIKKLQPSGLLEQKKEMENKLIDLLKKNNFSVDGCKTGELYEILFQYFEDFINYRDISYELMELKKKISNSASLIEKEKKLEKFSEEVEDIDRIINDTLDFLDLSIHPRPEHDGITRAIHDIDEQLEENGIEINEKKSLIIKFHEEIEEYDRIENSSLSAELRFEEIMKQIDESKVEKEHIKFLNGVFSQAADTWSAGKLEELSQLSLEKFLKLTDNSFIRDEISDTINSILLHSGKIKSEHKNLRIYISFSIKAALSEMIDSGDLPPVFIVDPFTPDNEFADNMKKLLPEFFPARQVIVILPGKDPDIKGNLINL